MGRGWWARVQQHRPPSKSAGCCGNPLDTNCSPSETNYDTNSGRIPANSSMIFCAKADIVAIRCVVVCTASWVARVHPQVDHAGSSGNDDNTVNCVLSPAKKLHIKIGLLWRPGIEGASRRASRLQLVRRRCPGHTAWRWIPICFLMRRMRFLAAFWSLLLPWCVPARKMSVHTWSGRSSACRCRRLGKAVATTGLTSKRCATDNVTA